MGTVLQTGFNKDPGGGGGTAAVTVTLGSTTTTGGTLLVTVVGYGTDATGFDAGDVSDNKGNSFTLDAEVAANTNQPAAAIYSCSNFTGGASHQVTVTTVNVEDKNIGVVEYSALTTFDKSATSAHDTSSPITSGTTATLTRQPAIAMAVVAIDAIVSATLTEDGDYTLVGEASDGTVDMVASHVYKLLSATAAEDCGWTWSGAFNANGAESCIAIYIDPVSAPALATSPSTPRQGPASRTFQWTQRYGADGVVSNDVSVILPDAATVTVTGNNSSAAVAPTVNAAAVTVTGNQVTGSVGATVGASAVTATSNNTDHAIAPTIGTAAVTTTANNSSAAVAPTIGTSVVTVTGNTAAPSTGVNVAVGSAAVTVTGNNSSAAVAPTLTAAAVTVTANNATVTTGADTNVAVGVATVTVVANNSGVSAAHAVGNAAVTVAAGQVTANPGLSVGAATVTATGNNATHQIASTIGYAPVVATGNNVTISASGTTNVAVGVAAVTVTGNQVTAAPALTVGSAAVTVAANQAAISLAASVVAALVIVTANNPAVDNGEGIATYIPIVRARRPKIWRIPVTQTFVDYLAPLTGTATTPDPGILPTEATWVFKVRGPEAASQGFQTVASQYLGTGNQRAWIMRRTSGAARGDMTTTTSELGISTITSATTPTTGLAITGDDEYLAYSRDLTLKQIRGWRSSDNGATYTATSAWFTYPTMTAVFDSNTVVRIGARDGTVEPWDSRIYWVELRTGLDPAAGTVLWRFDAADYPGTGTSWTDARGTTWTLTSAAAVVTAQDARYAYPAVRTARPKVT